MSDPRELLKSIANRHGFSMVRFARIGPTPRFTAFEEWLSSGHHANLAWMHNAMDVRADPRNRLPEAQTAMVLGIPHHHKRPEDPGGATGLVARYAWGRDYHNLVGKRLRKLRKELTGIGIRNFGAVDTGPILERAWAEAAGLGFSGKNCMQILPARSSWLFLAVVFVDVTAEPDAPLGDHCGKCSRCLAACPTDAFVGPHELDASKCIAYWTIEARTIAPRSMRSRFGRWFFGCDICQEVCPHNTSAPDAEEADLLPRNAWIDLPGLLDTPDDALMERFIGTPLRRPGANGLKRNALIVLGNLGFDSAVPSARRAKEHKDPMVRAASIWCLARLDERPSPTDTDPDKSVMDEINAVRNGEITS